MDDKKGIPEASKKRLDSLFEAFAIVAEGTYVYLCNMRYDYSRWSKTAVDSFGLPSEYMYGAGDIWEDHIHPEDRAAYHAGIDDVFSGNAAGHDMQYRARRTNGQYDVCTCRGVVIKDENGVPEYFGGVIRNHGIQGHMDTMTGLRNQYGFFEDLRSNLVRHNEIRICILGIGKFTEINEVYGYEFGNSILQKFGRYLFEHVGNEGSAYRLDGTKFAVISNTHTPKEMEKKYEDLRNHFRNGFAVEGKTIVLELNAGLLKLDNFDIDEQTIYACLNFAYGESKIRRQGDLVEFYNDITQENMHRIEKLHEIRASITQGYKGFYLMYQPVVDADRECLIGAEALLRWRSKDFSMVPPDDFIPVLERDPLFPELGRWILKTALTDAAGLLEKHPNFTINVNLSY
ncbi:MAG: EAL domain-containing protein, partial [Lachnospiraceae bacterium]|nr:EAL domain-containing protein [Lachnospiraceae bacterium]